MRIGGDDPAWALFWENFEQGIINARLYLVARAHTAGIDYGLLGPVDAEELTSGPRS